MEIASYLKKKEELSEIINSILEVKELPESHRILFNEKKRKLQEDEFSIALIGEFQGGKSTTFNALCDGREISPRGNNIKTSACRIKATNIAGNDQEFAEIMWKSNAELILSISKVLTSINPLEIGFKPEEKKVYNIIDYLNLENEEHRTIAKRAIEEEKKHLSVNDTDRRDILFIAEFIIEFYVKTKELREINNCSLEEATQLMVFPENMASRFSLGGIKSFTPEESLFAFVKSINCYIHSETLGRLGCTVTDCPGLFASDYDTTIALQTINEADATLYLLGGDKMIGKEDKRAINKIVEIKSFGKSKDNEEDLQKTFSGLFFAINQRKSDYETSFVDTDLTEIRNIGLPLKELSAYNALLFYLAQIGDSYLKGILDAYSVGQFLKMGEKTGFGNDFETIWVGMLNWMFSTLRINNRIEELSIDSTKLVRYLCKADKVFSLIEAHIISQKAHSILIDNGAKKVEAGLSSIEKDLKYRENAAIKDVMDKKAEHQKAKQEFGNFKKQVEGILEKSFPKESVMVPMIIEAYNNIFLNNYVINKISFQITKDVIDYMEKYSTRKTAFKNLLGKAWRIVSDNDKLEKETEMEIECSLKPIFNVAISSVITPIIADWKSNLESGKGDCINRHILPEINRISNSIAEKWIVAIEASDILKSIDVGGPVVSFGKSFAENVSLKNNFSSNLKDNVVGDSVTNAIIDTAQIGAAAISYIVGYIALLISDSFITFGLGAITALIILALGGKKDINSIEDLSSKQKSIYNQIHTIISNTFQDDINKSRICFNEGNNSLINLTNNTILSYKNNFRKELLIIENNLTEKIKQEEYFFSASKETLIKTAEEAKIIREKKIAPLHEKVNIFIQNFDK